MLSLDPPSSRMRLSIGAALLIVTLAPRVAAADERKLEVFHALRPFISAVESAKESGDFGGFGDDVAACRGAVDDGTAAGYQALDRFSDRLLWKQVATICDEYARLSRVKIAIDEVMPAFEEMSTMRGAFKTTNAWPSGVYRRAIDNAKQCIAVVDRVLEQGAPADVTFWSKRDRPDVLITLPEVRTQCRGFLAMAEKGVVALEAAEAAAAAAVRGKYTRLGITGDRLKYLVEADRRIVMGKGCRELALEAKKQAAVLYEMAEGETYWVVYKMAFKGDKLVKTTERRFSKLTSNGWSCK